MKILGKIIIAAVIIVIVVLGGLVLLGAKPQETEPQTEIIPSGADISITTMPKTPAATTTADNPVPAISTTIDEDLSDVDAQITGLNNDNANIEKGLSDAAGDAAAQ